MPVFLTGWTTRIRGLQSITAMLIIAAALLVQTNATLAQNQGQGSTTGTVVIPPGQTSVTLVVDGVEQTFTAGQTIDLSQNIAVPSASTVSFSLPNGSTVEPDSGSSFSVASSGNTVTVNLSSGTAAASSGTPGGNVTIANANGISISGTDVSSSYNPATQETTVEVNSGTATLSGSATNGTKTVTANETLNAADTTKKVFKVAFDDGTGTADTNTGFVAASQGPPSTPNVPNLPTVPVALPNLGALLPTLIATIVPPAQVDSASPGAP